MSAEHSGAGATMRALLAGAIDYAGLFPPAARSLEAAAASYAQHRAGPDAWALGRFVVPAQRLPELDRLRAALDPGASEPWPVSVILAPNVAGDAAAVRAYCDTATGLRVESVELPVRSVAELRGALASLPSAVTVYAEVPCTAIGLALLARCAGCGVRGKLRTGGVTPVAFPSVSAVLDFLTACAALVLPFKATAGLHHPLCGTHAVSDAPGVARVPMFGFLNLLLAAAALRAGAPRCDVQRVLCDAAPRGLAVGPDGIAWRGQLTFTRAALGATRVESCVGFGSCAFEEPLAELRACHLLRDHPRPRSRRGAPSSDTAPPFSC